MVYIYKKKAGDKYYYYLRASKRNNGKVVVKDLAYLGHSLEELKNAIEKLPKYREQIRKTYKTINNFLESNRYYEEIKKLKLKKDSFLREKIVELEACKLHYIKVFQKQNPLTKKEVWKNFIIEFAHNTTSIEGNTIKLEEVRDFLEENKTPKNKTLREIYDLQNTEKVLNNIISLKQRITHKLIIDIHKDLMKNIDNRTGYRNQNVRVLKSNFKSTPAPYVKTDMDLLIDWYYKNKSKLHPFVLAIIFHHKFEKIHPFMDGNGRTGRILLNYILFKNNLPPLIIKNRHRNKYLAYLRKADKSELFESEIEDYSGLVLFASDELVNNYWNIFL